MHSFYVHVLTFFESVFYRKKYEIATDEEFTPIKQDTKKGKLREFKKGDLYFNYGWYVVVVLYSSRASSLAASTSCWQAIAFPERNL